MAAARLRRAARRSRRLLRVSGQLLSGLIQRNLAGQQGFTFHRLVYESSADGGLSRRAVCSMAWHCSARAAPCQT